MKTPVKSLSGFPSERAAELAAKRYLTRAEAAEYATEMGIPTAPGTLQKLASVGGGPEYQICGRNALYRPAILLHWAESRLTAPRTHTSEAGV